MLAFQEMMDSGVMPETLSEGMIFLIPKEGGPHDGFFIHFLAVDLA